MLEFKPEDFDLAGLDKYGSLTYSAAADKANAKFKEWVESCEVVSAIDTNHHVWYPDKLILSSTHTVIKNARLFDIKEIEKECSHEFLLGNDNGTVFCKSCENKLKPTGWEVVE